MERVLKINGKNVLFAANNQTPLIYRKYFKKDFFQQLSKSFNQISPKLNTNKKKDRQMIVDNMDSLFFYQMVWTMARTADPKIPKMKKWLETMPEVSIIQLAVELSDMVVPLVKK